MIKKKISCILCILIAFLLQTTVFQSIALADVVPNLLLVVTVTYAYLRGRSSGLLVGFFCGIILDMAYGSVIGLYALIFMTIGFLVGFCQKIYFRQGFILPIILIVLSDFVYSIYYYITEFLMRGRLHFGFYFVHRILPEVLYTTLVGIVLYSIIATVERRLNTKRKENEF